MAMPIRRLIIEDGIETGKNPLAPKQPFRMLVIGVSNSGKTSTVLPMILDYLILDHIYIFSKYPDTPLYRKFEEELQELKEKEELIDYMISDSIEEFNIDLLDNETPKLLLFDDIFNESSKNKNEVSKLYTAGRHKKASVISIFQGFKSSSQKASRGSASHLMLFSGISDSDLKEIFNTYGLTDIGKYEDFKNLYSKINGQGNFLYIDLFSPNSPYTKYRLCFDRFYNPRTKSFEREPEDVNDIRKILDNLKIQNKSGGIVNLSKFELNKNAIDKLDIIIGEIESGNNSPILIEDLKKILRDRHAQNKISRSKAEEIYDKAIKKFMSLRK